MKVLGRSVNTFLSGESIRHVTDRHTGFLIEYKRRCLRIKKEIQSTLVIRKSSGQKNDFIISGTLLGAAMIYSSYTAVGARKKASNESRIRINWFRFNEVYCNCVNSVAISRQIHKADVLVHPLLIHFSDP